MKENMKCANVDIGYQINDRPLDTVIENLQTVKDGLEGKGYEDLRLELEAEEDYGSNYINISVTYFRPMTKDEIEERDLANKKRLDQVKAEELKQLKALQKKYGVKK